MTMAEPLKLRSEEEILADIELRRKEINLLNRELRFVEDAKTLYGKKEEKKA